MISLPLGVTGAPDAFRILCASAYCLILIRARDIFRGNLCVTLLSSAQTPVVEGDWREGFRG
jgi:hypothetical protein